MKQSTLSVLLAVTVSIAFIGCTSTRHAAATPDSTAFQMRLVLDAPSRDSTQMSVVQKTESPAQKEVLYVQNAVLLDQKALKSAKLIKDSFGHPQIAVAFTKSGQERFAEVTRDNVGKRLALVIDGQLYSAPVIRTEIPGGTANISGNFSEPEAKDLVTKINASLK